jgi:centrosomal protein CEP41
MLGITQNTKFLLLDMRDPEDYALFHVKEALNFPAPNIGRDKIIPELFRFKNQPDKLIIIYMSDERKGTAVAQVFFEKGYENVYLLSGGIEQFLEEFNELIEGKSIPQPPKKTLEETKQRSMEVTKKKHEQCGHPTSPPRRF